MPYGEKLKERCFSIDINALRAKEYKKIKQFLKLFENFVVKNIAIYKLISAFAWHFPMMN